MSEVTIRLFSGLAAVVLSAGFSLADDIAIGTTDISPQNIRDAEALRAQIPGDVTSSGESADKIRTLLKQADEVIARITDLASTPDAATLATIAASLRDKEDGVDAFRWPQALPPTTCTDMSTCLSVANNVCTALSLEVKSIAAASSRCGFRCRRPTKFIGMLWGVATCG